jgi:Zn-dependent metalloprotease
MAGLCLAFAASTASTAAPTPEAVREVARTQDALSHARANQARLGLGRDESLTVRASFTSPEGRTVVRLGHTALGARVWGSGAIAHVDPAGVVTLHARGLLAGAVPAGQPKLTDAAAIAAALHNLGLKGKHPAPRAELVVFPSARTEGLKLTFDRVTGAPSIDREFSVLARRPADDYVWAYEVRAYASNQQDGLLDVAYMIDANTGAILRKTSRLESAAAKAAKGTGRSQYSGTVKLDTTQDPDGTYSLHDQTRGVLVHPFYRDYYGIDKIGNWTLWEGHDFDNWASNNDYVGNASNTWGDGQPFLDYPHEGDQNGQTAAVDAHYGIATTWDMYKNVFGRNGIDGLGTTAFAEVHIRDPYFGGAWDNAFWSDYTFGMVYGDGTYLGDKIWGFAPYKFGMTSLTSLDITGHELTHGVTGSTAQLNYDGESGGLNEATSDIMGQMAVAWSKRGRGQDSVIPDGGNDWTIGSQVRPAGALRYMRHPRRDYVSADNWYVGIEYLDVHFSSGPMNRAFSYLAAGAPSDYTNDAYTPYLPDGMKGIGNDSAAHIWYKALTEYLTTFDDYAAARVAALAAATDLFGANSLQVKAVMKAFAAVNVGEAPGQAPRPKLSFPVLRSGGPIGRPDNWLSKTAIVPAQSTVTLQAQVTGAANTQVNWKVGGSLGDYNAVLGAADPTPVGVANPDGTWTAPTRLGWYVITASSAADPLVYGEGIVQVVNLDADDDSEPDAVDMGASAMSWLLWQSLSRSHSPYGNSWVDDFDAAFFVEGIKTAWGAK